MPHALLLLLALGSGPDSAATGPGPVGIAAVVDSAAVAPQPVTVPVRLDSLEVFVVSAEDSTAAQSEVLRVEGVLEELRAGARRGAAVEIRERDGTGLVLLDSLEVLAIRPENRADSALSPLGNALALRNAVHRAEVEATWNEEELLLRLLLGIVYPFCLLVVLRLVRTGLRRWERNWRGAVRAWMADLARRRGPQWERQGSRIINLATALERFAAFGLAISFLSFGWFALFPQTRPLALSFLTSVLGPIFAVAGGAVRLAALLLYSAAVVALAVGTSRTLAHRRRSPSCSALLRDPVTYFPLQAALWVTAVFLLLFPYPGAPRLFAVGVLLLGLLGVVLATRPLAEEVAAGMVLNGKHGLREGDLLILDGVPYHVIEPGLFQIRVLRDGTESWISYSRVLASELTVAARSTE